MASSSTSSIHKSFKYDVFLSFRGEDTRKNFVDHLYSALQQKSIHTYKDDERIEKGERISDQLMKSIEDSRFHIVIFSKNYASSSWCLEELVKIVECQKTHEQTTYPVFYDVEPSEVRKQIGEFGKVFAEHIEKKEAARKWRNALEEAANLAGWELKNTADGHEAKCIQKIVEEISLELRSINSSIDEKLVGMETRIKDIVSSLEASCDDVHMIGIKGIGGGGKTTLARAIFDQISIQYEGKSFVENVREVSKGSVSGLKLLQKQVLSDVLNDQSITTSSVYDLKNMMKERMCGRKVLIVLDDVDHINQLQALAGEPNWFKPGSRIIITTRDEQVLVAHRVSLIRDVNLLSHEEAICLFSKYAFGREIPIQGYEKLSRQVVCYAAGLPLTISVLGSFLCGKNELEWKDALERLKTIPLKETLEKLELSYIGLEEDYKEIFLDIACILKGSPKDEAIRVLESCGFYAQNGLRVLEQKSLISISKDGHLGMHDHIQEMGRNIVRRLHPDEPHRHSRLWINDEIEDILSNDLGTKSTRCIKLFTWKLNAEAVMKGFGNMKKLRYLCVSSSSAGDYFRSERRFDEVSQYFPNALRYLGWTNYPFRSLPKTFKANNLVGLDMSESKITQLWEGGERKVLNKLRFLNIDNSKLRTLDLGMAPNLEELSLKRCYYLEEIHMPFECLKLKSLNIIDSKLMTFDLRLTPNLEILCLTRCDYLVELHMLVRCRKLKYLNLVRLKLRTLDLVLSPNLETLSIEYCNDLVELHMPLGCGKLEFVNISYSKLIRTLKLTSNLKMLNLKGCDDFVELHMPVECLKLTSLNLSHSKLRTLDLGRSPNIERLNLERCDDFVELHMPVECLNLTSLNLSHSKLRTLDLERSPNLETLNLERCDDLVELRIPVECLKLRSLNLDHSKLRTLDLGKSPNLEKLSLKECYHLVELRAPIGCLKNLAYLRLSGCLRFKSFSSKRQFESFRVGSMSELHLNMESLDICRLHSNSNLPKFRFTCDYKEGVPSSTGNLEKLISLGLCVCTNLESFSRIICGLRGLTKLTLEGSIPEAPKDLEELHGLHELNLLSTKTKHLPDSICMLTHLKCLKLNPCRLLEKLPEDLGRLKCLEELILSDCVFLRDIPDSICKMKRLRCFHLRYCVALEKLPEEIGRLKCLEELNIEGTRITHLPQSIFVLKGLRVVGFRWLLELCGFTSKIQTSEHETFCYI